MSIIDLKNAIYTRDIDKVKLFLSSGYNWNYLLEISCIEGNVEIVKLMIEKGANNWNYSLIAAYHKNNITIVNLLILKIGNIPEYCSYLSTEQIYLFYKSSISPSERYKRWFNSMKEIDKEAGILYEEFMIKDIGGIILSY